MHPRPSDNPMKRTMVVGGVASYVKGTMRQKLATWGFDVVAHREMKERMTPGGVTGHQALIIFEEMVPSRDVVNAWRAEASRVGVECITLDRHESHWPKVLDRHGYRKISPITAAAVAASEEAMATPPVKVVPPPPEPTKAPSKALEEKLDQIKLLLLEAKELGLHRLTFDGTSGKLTFSRPVLVEDTETL